MIPILGTLLAIAALLINLAAPDNLLLPDLSGALLIAALAARRRHWPWVLPLLLLHDLILYWEPWPPTQLAVIAALLLLVRIDLRLGAALPQRVALLVIALIPMAIEGWNPRAIALTLLLAVALWYWIRDLAIPSPNGEQMQPETR